MAEKTKRKSTSTKTKKVKIVDISLDKLETLYQNIKESESNSDAVLLTQIEEAIWTKKTMIKLKEDVDQKGIKVTMNQHTHEIEVSNPALKEYVSYAKVFQGYCKLIMDALLKQNINIDDGFDSFGL
ncbi:MAG: hypothetical protein MJ244_06395 [Clostridia bacterium]|nr:hypothetical protein [Clostridia bacterium]